MKITVNGEASEYDPHTTVADIVSDIGAEQQRAAVILNEDIVQRNTWSQTQLADGDAIEVLVLAGGG